jgi:hypothetical protein
MSLSDFYIRDVNILDEIGAPYMIMGTSDWKRWKCGTEH